MGLFSKMKEMIGIEEIDDDDLEEEILAKAKAPVPERKMPDPRPPIRMQPEVGKGPVDMRQSTLSGGRRTDQFKMVVVEPTGFDDCPRLVDNLKAKKPVIINLENLETDVARKIFDFLSGATYALNGNVQKVSNNIFVFVPENVDLAYTADGKASLIDSSLKNPWK